MPALTMFVRGHENEAIPYVNVQLGKIIGLPTLLMPMGTYLAFLERGVNSDRTRSQSDSVSTSGKAIYRERINVTARSESESKSSESDPHDSTLDFVFRVAQPRPNHPSGAVETWANSIGQQLFTRIFY